MAAHSSRERSPDRRRERDAPRYASRKCLDEEIQLPRQLLDVEGRSRMAGSRVDASSAPRRCSVSMSATACAIERAVLGRRCGAEVRLQRHVAQILQREDAEGIGWPRMAGTGSGICCSSRATLANGSAREVDRVRVQCQHRSTVRPAK